MKNKTILSVLSLILFSSFFLNAQTVSITLDKESQKYTYLEVLNVESGTVEELYERAKNWIALGYAGTKHTVHFLGDKEEELIIKGQSSIKYGIIKYNLILQFKENRYRVKTTDFCFNSYNPQTRSQINSPLEEVKLVKQGVIRQSTEKLQAIIEDLHQHMQKDLNKDSDDW